MNDFFNRLEMQGPSRRKALERFAAQLKEWDFQMPAVEPVVLEFGLDDFEKTGLIECWIVNEIQAGYCGKYLFLFDGQTCPCHRHHVKHETFSIVKGKVRMTVDHGPPKIMNAGDVLRMPLGQYHSFQGIGNVLILEISTPCIVTDNDFEENRIKLWLRKLQP